MPNEWVFTEMLRLFEESVPTIGRILLVVGCWGATGQKTGVRALTTRPGLENETRS